MDMESRKWKDLGAPRGLPGLFRTGKLDPGYLLLSAAIIVVCVAVAYLVYNKRDLYI